MLARSMVCLTMLWMTFSIPMPGQVCQGDVFEFDGNPALNAKGHQMIFKAYAKKHPTTFKIPDGTFEDLEMLDVVTTFIKENLIAQWESMKQKCQNQGKYVLAKSLATSGHEVTMEHWAHFAFLHSTFVSFQTAVEQSKATSATQDSTAEVDNRDGNNNSPEALGLDPATRENEEPDKVAVANTMEKTWNWLSTDYWEFVDLLLHDVRQEAHAVGKMPLEHEKIVKT
ncbi:hypothetical protein BDR04DRAFT_1117781 [Suillus decipiens]|nr:hypothetical protein BDR04DRAFT_1117781 [Suillus decipiens]